MSARIDKSWTVFESIENFERDRCVDLFRRPDGTYGFEEFRRDPEDAGAVLFRRQPCLEGRGPESGDACRGLAEKLRR